MSNLEVLNNRSGLIFSLIMKNHMVLMVREANDAGGFKEAATFFNKDQAKEMMIYLSNFIEYDGSKD